MAEENQEYGVLMEEDKQFLKDKGFKIICNIGSSFDHLVFKASTQSGEIVAVKYLEITTKRKQKYLDREIEITDFLRLNPHKNIIKVLANIKSISSNKIFTVMEFGDSGDLVTFFQRRKWTPIDEPLAKNWFGQLLDGVKWLHNKGIAHRDIKADNIVMFREGDSFLLKLTDLEMAIFGIQKMGRFSQTVKCKTICGSIDYSAPEIFVMDYNPFLADIYSLGVVLHIFIVGTSPFNIFGSDLLELNDRIEKSLELKNNPNFNFPETSNHSVRDLINRMLAPMPENRICLTDILKSNWVLN